MKPGRSRFVDPIREVTLDTQALRIAQEHCGPGRVEPETIARNLGIGFRYAAFQENFDGVLLHDSGKFYIVCNDRRFPRGSPRSRFTFAHELGHALIREHGEALKRGVWPVHYSRTEFTSSDPLEREADIFAAALLLPRESFWSRIRLPFRAEQLAGLGDHFGVSLTAVAYRALRTGLLPAPGAVIRWDATGQRVGRNVARASDDEALNCRCLVDSPPAHSPTACAIAELRLGITSDVRPATDWFTDVPGYLATTLLVREEVISLGSYGWLTLLSNSEPADSDST